MHGYDCADADFFAYFNFLNFLTFAWIRFCQTFQSLRDNHTPYLQYKVNIYWRGMLSHLFIFQCHIWYFPCSRKISDVIFSLNTLWSFTKWYFQISVIFLNNVSCLSSRGTTNSDNMSRNNISSLCCLIQHHLGSFLAHDSQGKRNRLWIPAYPQTTNRSKTGYPASESSPRDAFITSEKKV